MKWFAFVLLCSTTLCEDLEFISKTQTSYLERYQEYVSAVIVHIEIPKDAAFAAIKLQAGENKMSIFGCSPRKVSLFMKHESLPVINPDGSKFPKDFKTISRNEPIPFELMSNKAIHYYNFTAPDPGCYYFTVFLPYSDPRYEPIQPPGLSARCHAYVDVSLYIRRANATQIVNGTPYKLTITSNSTLLKFYVPEIVTHAIIIVDEIAPAPQRGTVILRIEPRRIPTENNAIKTTIITSQPTKIPFTTRPGNWHYAHFTQKKDSPPTNLRFRLKYFFEEFPDGNVTDRSLPTQSILDVGLYHQHDLARVSSTESFSQSYELVKQLSLSASVAVNLTNHDLALLRFKLREHTDVGGTLQTIVAFKPRVNRKERLLEPEPPNHRIVACIHPGEPELPQWPNLCVTSNGSILAPMVLNETAGNSTILIPYPEAGPWYVTFRLFCSECVACNCSEPCQSSFELCLGECEAGCDEGGCYNCSVQCRDRVAGEKGCAGCDCEGGCLKSNDTCESSVIFDIGALACVNNCGRNGRCMFMVSDGIVYSTCVCTNNYRGWDCSDDSLTTPYYMVVLELLLLVLSNLMFLPTVFFAYRRKYYTEAVVYFSICFFSTFYHACDAGENLISFCLTRLAPLQFADFYCALLAIWVTLIAIADLAPHCSTLCHIAGAIILAFITTINKTAVWVFVIPAVIGLFLIGVSWFLKWRKVRQMFLDRRYLYVFVPLGSVVVVLGLCIYSFLETNHNYKYLHSMWHMIMATAVILLLPREDTFQPESVL